MMKHDNLLGAFLGVALGDAMGKQAEFMGMKMIHKTYGRTGHIELPQRKVTDDTHMSLYVARALLEVTDERSPRAYAREFRRAFVDWVNNPDSHGERASGNSCRTAARALAVVPDRRWARATTISKGCGANMRVVGITSLPTELIGPVTQQQAAITHGHPLSIVASELTALAITWAGQGIHPRDLVYELLGHCDGVIAHPIGAYDTAWLNELHRRWPQAWGTPDQAMIREGWEVNRNLLAVVEQRLVRVNRGGNACDGLGEGWHSDEALAVGLYCAAAHADDPVGAISRGTRTSGDSDSIASIAGAIVGAYHGASAWPAAWVRRVEFSELIHTFARDLVDAYHDS